MSHFRASAVLLRTPAKTADHTVTGHSRALNMATNVELEWKCVSDDHDPLWSSTRVLYAWCHPQTRRILYLGKADYLTVRRRFDCPSKDGVWEYLNEELGIDEVDLLVGEFNTNARLTPELLEDTETLLITELQPCCNIQCTKSRIQRPGLRVTCRGDWPERRARFVDR